MPKIVIECSDPNDLGELENLIDQAQGKCNITYFKQHEALVDAGVSKSKSESSRIIAEGTGETPESVRHRIRSGEKEVVGEVRQPKSSSKMVDIVKDIKALATPSRKSSSHGGQRKSSGRPAKPKFNETNDSIKWAKYTWNPVTGCEHGCDYCYARDMANRFYPEKFKPTFRPERLSAPANMPESTYPDNFVFVCSMGDLFGDWVKQDWIDMVIDVVAMTPKWYFIFLTKNPERMIPLDWPDNVIVGATVDIQSRVGPTENAFRKIKAKRKFVSCEPLLEPIKFSNIDIFNWLIIGARSKTTKLPEFQPERKWVTDLYCQAAGIDGIFMKPNLISGHQDMPF